MCPQVVAVPEQHAQRLLRIVAVLVLRQAQVQLHPGRGRDDHEGELAQDLVCVISCSPCSPGKDAGLRLNAVVRLLLDHNIPPPGSSSDHACPMLPLSQTLSLLAQRRRHACVSSTVAAGRAPGPGTRDARDPATVRRCAEGRGGGGWWGVAGRSWRGGAGGTGGRWRCEAGGSGWRRGCRCCWFQ